MQVSVAKLLKHNCAVWLFGCVLTFWYRHCRCCQRVARTGRRVAPTWPHIWYLSPDTRNPETCVKLHNIFYARNLCKFLVPDSWMCVTPFIKEFSNIATGVWHLLLGCRGNYKIFSKYLLSCICLQVVCNLLCILVVSINGKCFILLNLLFYLSFAATFEFCLLQRRQTQDRLRSCCEFWQRFQHVSWNFWKKSWKRRIGTGIRTSSGIIKILVYFVSTAKLLLVAT